MILRYLPSFLIALPLAAQWADLSSTTLKAVAPANCTASSSQPYCTGNAASYQFNTLAYSVMNAWGGAAADTVNNRMIIWGGGHGDYSGNEVYALNLGTSPPTMTRLTDPSAPFGVGSDMNPDGTPVSRHTYGSLIYLPNENAMFTWGTGDAPNGQQLNPQYAWWFNLSSNTWARHAVVPGGNTGVVCQIDPTQSTESVLCIDFGAYGMYRYTPGTDAFTQLSGTSVLTLVPYLSNCTVNPAQKVMICAGPTSGQVAGIYSISLAAGSTYAATNITASTSGCGALYGVNAPGLDYDSKTGLIMAYTGSGNSVIAYNYVAGTCTTTSYAGGPTAAGYAAGMFGRFAYFPGLNKHVVVNSAVADAFTLTLSSGSGSGAGSSAGSGPTVPTNVSAVAVSSSQVNLSWSASTDSAGIAGYRVYRSGSQIAIASGLSYSDTGLTPLATYSYTIAAFDSAGNVSGQSAAAGATTQSADTTPPTVSITAPSASATVSGTITLSANATDNVAIAQVQFKLDGVNVGSAATLTPYSISWNSSSASNASHTLTAVATDTSGNSAISAAVTITISNTATSGGSLVNGLGLSTAVCVDRDGDGYGAGYNALVHTSIAGSISAGAQTVTPASMAGISAGMKLRIGLGANVEQVVVTGITTSTFTGTFAVAHPSAVSVLDLGCLGPDADDNDASVWNSAQAIAKYGSIAGLLQKRANDIITENPFGDATMTAAVAAGLTTPHATWYLAPATASANCAGNASQCTGSDSNACTLNAPCLTEARLGVEGLTTSDMVFFRDGWDGTVFFPVNGTASVHATLMSYPGEHAVWDLVAIAGSKINVIGVSYLSILDMRFQNGADIGGGTPDGTSPSTNHNVYIAGNDMGTSAQIGNINAFNGVNNWVIEYNALHDNQYMHGIYLGSRQLPSSNTTIRRNIVWNNAYAGIHFNGRVTGLVVDQNFIAYNGSNSVTFNNGVSHSFVRGNVMVGALNAELQINNYEGACGASFALVGPASYICSYDQNYNLIENNTFYNFSTGVYAAIQVSNDTTGCAYTATTCPSPTLQGDLGNNTYRNNIFVSLGNGGNGPVYAHPPILFNNCVSGTSSYFGGSNSGPAQYPWTGPCLFNTADTYLATSTFDHNLVFEIGPYTDSNAIGWGPVNNAGGKYTSHSQTGGYGYYPLTWAAAGTVATVTGGLNGDPQFVSASSAFTNTSGSQFDFRVLSTSPALHTGSAVAAPVYDIQGNAFASPPSLGPYEVPGASVAAVSCDLNADGAVNVLDVQSAINQALGTSACTTADLQQNGQCNVIDVQRVITASLGGSCLTGP